MNENNPTGQYLQQVLESQRELYVFILKLLPRRTDADEVLQESNVVLLAKAGEFETGTDFRAWSRTIVRFQIQALRKRQGRDRLRFSDTLLETIIAEEGVDSPENGSQRVALDMCVESLGKQDREMLDLRYRENLRAAEIAKKLGRTANAVYQVLFRIRAGLARCVEQRLAREERT